mmetsp:Transcript_25285/g.75473  ORF Transcript_25285/g.75473 Transcript_25285/m.75473 type:complete len:226 (-) Transcript_25285:453-1130(-)
MPLTSISCSRLTWLQKCTMPSNAPTSRYAAQESSSISVEHMSTAPWWCGIMPRTKSTCASPVKLTAMPRCILMFTPSHRSTAFGQRSPPQTMVGAAVPLAPCSASAAASSPHGVVVVVGVVTAAATAGGPGLLLLLLLPPPLLLLPLMLLLPSPPPPLPPRASQVLREMGGSAGQDTTGKQLGSTSECCSEKSDMLRWQLGVAMSKRLQKFSTQVPTATPNLPLV